MAAERERSGEPVDEYEELGLRWNLPRLLLRAEQLLSKLENSLGLPDVDEDGHSECPFAEHIYAEKEEAEEVVTRLLENFHGYLQVIEKRLKECEINLRQIRADSTQLNSAEAREHYSAAEIAEIIENSVYMRQKRQVEDIIPRMEKALAEAAKKQYPGKKPEKSEGFLSGGGSYWPTTAPVGFGHTGHVPLAPRLSPRERLPEVDWPIHNPGSELTGLFYMDPPA